MIREEAIEKVRRMSLPKEIREILEALAPELRESEDEKIRKGLVQFLTEIKNISEGGRDSWHVRKEDAKMCTDFLAYLEKQKEPPTNEEMLRTLRAEYEKGVADTIAKYEQKEQKEIPLMNGDADLYFDTWRQEVPVPTFRQCFEEGMRYTQRLQKEQKPLVYRMNGLMQDYIKDTKDPEEQEHRRKCYDLFWEALEDADYFKQKDDDIRSEVYGSLNPPPKIPEQKPAEWSEEDDEMVEEIKHIVFGAGSVRNGMRGKIHDWLYNRLKYLCPAKQEWSEEDKTMINHIIEALPKWANGLITILPSQAEEYVKRLKSLRPSWKPSEWQMSMLLAVINDPNNAGSESCYLTLKSIYEQLKKL